MAGTAERGVRRKVEGRSEMGDFWVGEGRDSQNRARWGVESVDKGVEKWLGTKLFGAHRMQVLEI